MTAAYVRDLATLRHGDADQAGSKGANLGELIDRRGAPRATGLRAAALRLRGFHAPQGCRCDLRDMHVEALAHVDDSATRRTVASAEQRMLLESVRRHPSNRSRGERASHEDGEGHVGQ